MTSSRLSSVLVYEPASASTTTVPRTSAPTASENRLEQCLPPDVIVAASHIYGGPIIVIDIGTGLVFNAITAEGEYIGGAIAPGLRIAAEAMYQRTSMLRRIELVAPPAAIGRSTVASMQSGVIYGYAELVEGMVRRFKQELAPNAPDSCKVIATGGLSSVLEPHVTCFDHVDIDLTLKGLRIVHEMNSR